MFRSISDRLSRRLEKIKTTQIKIALVRKLVDRFILETYQTPLRYETTYDPDSKEVVIVATSKTTASDLVLRTPQLSALLRKNGCEVTRLMIR